MLALENVGVTVAVAVFDVSACAIAVTVTVPAAGGDNGAVYTPVLEIVPTIAFPPATPFTCHVAFLLLLLLTVAVNC
jgi:hypothetical protein